MGLTGGKEVRMRKTVRPISEEDERGVVACKSEGRGGARPCEGQKNKGGFSKTLQLTGPNPTREKSFQQGRGRSACLCAPSSP